MTVSERFRANGMIMVWNLRAYKFLRRFPILWQLEPEVVSSLL